jgi:membrane fusion protein, multidrug efflux system
MRTVLFLSLILVLVSCNKTEPVAKAAGEPGPPAIGVKLATATLRSMPIEIKTIGKVEAFASITVKSVLTGTLMKAHFTEGDTVKQGALLFEIDPRPYQEAVRQWEANLARDKALVAQAEATLTSAQSQEAFYGLQATRYEKLAAEGVGSREHAEQAAVEARARRTNVRAVLANIDSLKATIRASEASLDNAKLNLSYCTIRAALTGRTGDMRSKPGNLIKANDTDLVTIHQVQPTYVSFTVPEIRLATLRQRLKAGALTVSAAIPGDTGADAKGTIAFLDNSVDSATGTIRLKATFPNADTRLWPGQFVQVRVHLEEQQNAVVIPAAALQNSQSGSYVYVVTANQTVELRPVTTGVRADRDIAIDKGLAAGEKVVTEGQMRLAPGSKIKAAA